MEVNLNKSNFENEVLKDEKIVLVDFWATWCGPCRMVGPVIESLAEEYEGKTSVCKLNVDENPDLATEYKIMSIPTVMIMKNGEIVDKAVGVRTREEYQNMIEKAL